MQLTRQQIIDYLETNRLATSVELSRALQVTTANVRHHLKLLQEAHLVEVVGQQPGRGRGRPMFLYSLTESARKNNIEGLSGALLRMLFTDRNLNQLDALADQLLGEFEIADHPRVQLEQAIKKLNQLQYQASWEAYSGGPRVILRNCPYAVLIANHPELCQLDAIMLGCLLDQPVQQIAKLERQPDGAPHCAFVTHSK